MTNFDQHKQKVTAQFNAVRDIIINLFHITISNPPEENSSTDVSKKPKSNLHSYSFLLKGLYFLIIVVPIATALLIHFNVISLNPSIVQSVLSYVTSIWSFLAVVVLVPVFLKEVELRRIKDCPQEDRLKAYIAFFRRPIPPDMSPENYLEYMGKVAKEKEDFYSFILKCLCAFLAASLICITFLFASHAYSLPPFINNHPSPSPSPSATPVPIHQTPVATISSLPTTPVPTNFLYQDALNNQNNQATVNAQWDQNNLCSFASDGYHVKETQLYADNLHPCNEAGHTYGDATISVDTQFISGSSATLLVCSHRTTPGGFLFGYKFNIGTDGSYTLSYRGLTTPPAIKGTSSAINKTTNTLTIKIQGGRLLFSVNGTFLNSLPESNATSGTIAFIASTNDTPADIIFSNLRVSSV